MVGALYERPGTVDLWLSAHEWHGSSAGRPIPHLPEVVAYHARISTDADGEGDILAERYRHDCGAEVYMSTAAGRAQRLLSPASV